MARAFGETGLEGVERTRALANQLRNVKRTGGQWAGRTFTVGESPVGQIVSSLAGAYMAHKADKEEGEIKADQQKSMSGWLEQMPDIRGGDPDETANSMTQWAKGGLTSSSPLAKALAQKVLEKNLTYPSEQARLESALTLAGYRSGLEMREEKFKADLKEGEELVEEDKPLTKFEYEKLDAARVQQEMSDRLVTDFKPEYSGYGILGDPLRTIAGAAGSMGTETMQKGHKWWSDWERNLEMVQRHDLFGAALTSTENPIWMKARQLKPGDDPKVIQETVTEFQKQANRALESKAKTFAHGGRRKAVLDALGWDEERLPYEAPVKKKTALPQATSYSRTTRTTRPRALPNAQFEGELNTDFTPAATNLINQLIDGGMQEQEIVDELRNRGIPDSMTVQLLNARNGTPSVSSAPPAAAPVVESTVTQPSAGEVTGGPVGAPVAEPVVSSQPVKVTSKAEVDALPSGTKFIGPSGTVRIKP